MKTQFLRESFEATERIIIFLSKIHRWDFPNSKILLILNYWELDNVGCYAIKHQIFNNQVIYIFSPLSVSVETNSARNTCFMGWQAVQERGQDLIPTNTVLKWPVYTQGPDVSQILINIIEKSYYLDGKHIKKMNSPVLPGKG